VEPTETAAEESASAPANGDAALVDAEAAPKRPWWGVLAIAAFIGLVICSRVADSVWATWDNERPGLLLLMSSRIRFLLAAVAAGIGILPYVVIASLRIAAAFVVCHLIGRAYREDVLRIFTRYLGLTPEALEAYHKGLDKAEIVIVPFFAGSNIIAALTGVRQTPPARLAVLLAVGIAGRLALYWWLGKVFEKQISDIMRFVDRYQLWAVLISIALVILVNVRNFRRGAKV
jgi:membrane protein DedA with SNARE-associated domain